MPEIVAALKDQNERIRRVECDLAAARQAPKHRADALAEVEAAVHAKLGELRTVLDQDPNGAAELYRCLFPEGLRFEPVELGRRRVFRIGGAASFDKFLSGGDPSGILTNRNLRIPAELLAQPG